MAREDSWGARTVSILTADKLHAKDNGGNEGGDGALGPKEWSLADNVTASGTEGKFTLQTCSC